MICLAEVYSGVNLIFAHYWVAAAAVNSTIAAIYILWNFKKINLRYFWLAVPIFAILLFQHAGIKLVASVTLIPVVEEFTFRGFFRNLAYKFYGKVWGSYASIVFFALAHSQMTLHNTFSLNFRLFLGPLFLGLFCELLMLKFNKFWPVILLHIFCNLTPVLLLAVDPRWLTWLNWLYIKSSP